MLPVFSRSILPSIDLSSNIQEGVDKMNNEFEKCIMKLPGQYSWEYKKFKRTKLDSIYINNS